MQTHKTFRAGGFRVYLATAQSFKNIIVRSMQYLVHLQKFFEHTVGQPTVTNMDFIWLRNVCPSCWHYLLAQFFDPMWSNYIGSNLIWPNKKFKPLKILQNIYERFFFNQIPPISYSVCQNVLSFQSLLFIFPYPSIFFTYSYFWCTLALMLSWWLFHCRDFFNSNLTSHYNYRLPHDIIPTDWPAM